MAGGGGHEQSYWPGFVDALSNVVLTLVFVLVVFVFALVMASAKVERKAIEMVAAAQAEQNPDERVVELKAQLSISQEELQQLKDLIKQQKEEIDQQKQKATEAQEEKEVILLNAEIQKEEEKQKGSVQIKEGHNKIVLTYPATVSVLNDEVLEEIEAAIHSMMKKTGAHSVELRSVVGVETYSMAHRLAYYRAMNLRNFILNKKFLSEQNIVSKVIKPETKGEGHVEIIFFSK